MISPDKTLSRILVVDAVPESAGLIELILKKFGGNEVSRAGSIDEAIEQIAMNAPELVLLDADMPDNTALRFCAQIGKYERTRFIPVILFSEKKDRRLMIKGFESGAVDFMFKPIYPMELAARARTHLQLKRQKDETEQMAVEQKELVQVMCHDITGPVSASMNLLEMTRDDPEMLQEVVGDVIEALAKVNDMTDLVRKMRSLDEGKMKWELSPIPLKSALDDSLSVLRQRLKDKRITLRLEIDEKVSVLAEKVSLVNSVISNLLTNAIKFSPLEGVLEVSASLDGEQVVLQIRDHGIGMPESIRKNLFNINVPTSRPGTQNEPGTGFGMPLVKKFIAAYGGSIEITSKDIDEHPDDSGTCVKLTFLTGAPAAPPAPVLCASA